MKRIFFQLFHVFSKINFCSYDFEEIQGCLIKNYLLNYKNLKMLLEKIKKITLPVF